MLGSLAEDVHEAVQGQPGGSTAAGVGCSHEQLAERGFGRLGRGTDHRVIDGKVAPAEDLEALFDRQRLHLRCHHVGLVGLPGQEGDTGGVATGIRQLERDDRTVEGVRNLQQQARTVPGVLLRPEGAAVLHVAEGADSQRDDLVAGLTAQVADEVDTAGVMLESRVVQALGHRPMIGHGLLTGSVPTLGTTLWRSPRASSVGAAVPPVGGTSHGHIGGAPRQP